MRHLKLLGVTLVAMFSLGVTALGMTATSASALTLPDVSILSGETFPLYLQFKDNGTTPTLLETANGGLLEGKGVELLLELASLSALGSFKTSFLSVKEAGSANKCNTEGDAAGTVLITGEWHLVPLTTTPTLTDGIAFLLTNLVLIKCEGGVVFDIRGCALASSGATENSVDLTSTSGVLATDGKGKNVLSEYLNDGGAKTACHLTEEIVGAKKPVTAAEGVNNGTAITLGIESNSLAKMFFFSNL